MLHVREQRFQCKIYWMNWVPGTPSLITLTSLETTMYYAPSLKHNPPKQCWSGNSRSILFIKRHMTSYLPTLHLAIHSHMTMNSLTMTIKEREWDQDWPKTSHWTTRYWQLVMDLESMSVPLLLFPALDYYTTWVSTWMYWVWMRPIPQSLVAGVNWGWTVNMSMMMSTIDEQEHVITVVHCMRGIRMVHLTYDKWHSITSCKIGNHHGNQNYQQGKHDWLIAWIRFHWLHSARLDLRLVYSLRPCIGLHCT